MFARIARGSAWFAVTGILLLQGTAFADQYHYTNLLIGDRASGMSGAYTAVSDDASGLFYNPAGIMYSTGRDLSASVNAFSQSTKEYDGVIGGHGWKRKSSSLLPNFFGIVQPVGKFKVGFSYAVPDSQQEDQDQTFYNFPSSTPGVNVTQYVVNFNNDDTTYNFGPSIAMEIAKDLSIGATLYIHHRQGQSILNQYITLDTGQTQWESSYYEIVERGYRPVLGVMWSPQEKVSVGLSIAQTIVYGTSAQAQTTFMDTTGTTSIQFDGSSSNKKYPTQLRMGVAVFPSGSLLVAADAFYSTKVTDAVYGNKVSVLNGSLGMEYYLNKNWAVRAGLFTDLANTPDIQSNRVNQQEHVDLYGLSASISNFTRNSSVTLGMNMNSGSGKAQLIGNDPSVQNVSITNWMLFLSSTYTF